MSDIFAAPLPPAGTIADNLVFPIEDISGYRARVTFSSYFEDYPDLFEAGASIFQPGIFEGVPPTAQTVDLAKEIAQRRSNAFDEERHKGKKAVAAAYSKVTKKDVKQVTMYLPASIQIADKIDYSQPELGILGSAAFIGTRAAFQGATMSAADIANYGAAKVGSALNAIMDGDLATTASALAVQRTAQKFSAPEIAGGVASAIGIAVNPNKRNILGGVALRSFRFQFKLIARSQKESDRINSIIYLFRSRMYPKLTDDAQIIGSKENELNPVASYSLGFEGMSAGLNYPAKFDIKMYYIVDGDPSRGTETWNRTSDEMDTYTGSKAKRLKTKRVGTEILPCFLESFEAVYNPQSMSFHPDGSPSEVDISMTFIEERALNSGDIQRPKFFADYGPDTLRGLPSSGLEVFNEPSRLT